MKWGKEIVTGGSEIYRQNDSNYFLEKSDFC